jgi:hypothetical protein
MTVVRLLISISVCIVILAADLVRAEDRKLTVFAAGSLREALGAIGEDFGGAHKIQIRTEFGPSGRMRERIERRASRSLRFRGYRSRAHARGRRSRNRHGHVRTELDLRVGLPRAWSNGSDNCR